MSKSLALNLEPRRCGWCLDAPAVTTWQATPCCDACAKATAKDRVLAWLQRVGRQR